MVEGGGSGIDPRRLSVEKPTRVKMTFYFAECMLTYSDLPGLTYYDLLHLSTIIAYRPAYHI